MIEFPIAQRLKTVEEYFFSQKLQEINQLNKNGQKVINLGIGSPDLPPHAKVIKALMEDANLPTSHAYQSYEGLDTFRNSIAEWYKKYYAVTLDPQQEILPLIGSKEGIMHICMTFLDPGSIALIPNPGYPTYSSAIQLAGGKIICYTLSENNNWRIDKNKFEKLIQHKCKIVWLNSPHMPTGQEMKDEDVEYIIDMAIQHKFLICHDNPYSFIRTDKPKSIFRFPKAKQVCLELNSLSKSHNMAGWRVGMLIGRKDILQLILRFKSNMDSGMFHSVQIAASVALQLGQDWYDNLNILYKKRENKILEIMNMLKCTCYPNQSGLFVWGKIPFTYKNSYLMSDAILHKLRIFITPGSIFGSEGNQYIRISLCSNEHLLKEVLQRIQHN